MMKTARLLIGLAAIALTVSSASAQGIGGFEGSMSEWMLQIERMISAVKVEVRQDNTSAGQQASVSRDTDKASAYSFVETDAKLALNNARQRYESMQTAVAGLCGDVEANRAVAKAEDLTSGLSVGQGDFEARWNRDGGRRVDVLAATQSLREGPLCPYGEAALGLCDPNTDQYVGGYRAGDTDAGIFLLRNQYGQRRYGNAEAESGMIYKDTLAPMATIQSQADAEAGGTAARAARIGARREQALISLARSALDDVILRGLEGGDVSE